MSKKSYSKKLTDPRWQKKRLEIFNRDKWQCTWCKETKEMLIIHHLIYHSNTEPWEYDDSELTTLCDTCHKYKHNLGLLTLIKAENIYLDKPYNDKASRLIDELIVLSEK